MTSDDWFEQLMFELDNLPYDQGFLPTLKAFTDWLNENNDVLGKHLLKLFVPSTNEEINHTVKELRKLTAAQYTRVLIKEGKEKSSKQCIMLPFHNRLTQLRHAAYDNGKWYAQFRNTSPFTPVSGSDMELKYKKEVLLFFISRQIENKKFIR